GGHPATSRKPRERLPLPSDLSLETCVVRAALCCAAVINFIRKDQTMRSFALLIAGLVGLAAMPASARDYKAGTLTITDPWSRATPKGASVGAGYLKIVNTGTAVDPLRRGSPGPARSFYVPPRA